MVKRYYISRELKDIRNPHTGFSTIGEVQLPEKTMDST
jgi:hypothetical protein